MSPPSVPNSRRRLARDRSGLALIEFAIALPIFVLLSLTGAEVTNLVITRMRVSQLALHLADNMARIGTGDQLAPKIITETQINDAIVGAQLQSGEMGLLANGRVIVSSLQGVANPNTTNKYKIMWQRCAGRLVRPSSFGREDDTNLNGIGPPGRQVQAPENGATIFVEIAYTYRPIIAPQAISDNLLVETASMTVRDQRVLAKPDNTMNDTVSRC